MLNGVHDSADTETSLKVLRSSKLAFSRRLPTCTIPGSGLKKFAESEESDVPLGIMLAVVSGAGGVGRSRHRSRGVGRVTKTAVSETTRFFNPAPTLLFCSLPTAELAVN